MDLSNASRSSSQEPRQSRTREDEHTHVLALYDISVAFCHAQVPHGEPIAMYPPRGEEEAGHMCQMTRAIYGTGRASRLFQEHMKGVLKEAGYAALKVCMYTTALRRTRWLQSMATTSSLKESPRS